MERKNKKYEDILIAAREMFWKYGFKRVTIEEICMQARVSKMTFYKFFPNKLEVAREVFDREAFKGVLEFRKIMESTESAADKISRILLLKLQGTNDISREFISDFYNNPDLGLKDHIEQTTISTWQQIINDFKKAQENGVIRKDFRPELIWYLAQKMMEMISDDSLLKLYKNPQEMIMELAAFFMYGMIPQKESK